MSNWHAAIATWVKRSADNKKTKTDTRPYNQRSAFWDSLPDDVKKEMFKNNTGVLE